MIYYTKIYNIYELCVGYYFREMLSLCPPHVDKLGSDEYVEDEDETPEDSTKLEEEYQEALGNIWFFILQATFYSWLLDS